METSDIEHLATLSRIHLTPEEIEAFKRESDAILSYVDAVKELALSPRLPKVGVHENPLRADTPTHEPGVYTDDLLSALPKRDGRYALVKKILNTEDEG